MPDDAEAPEDTSRNRLELAAAILLGIAALLSAWTAFQSGKAGGDATDAANAANKALVDANFFFSQGNQQVASDTQLFISYIQAGQTGDADLAGYLFNTLMSPNLQEAVAFFEDPSTEAVTPFDPVEGNPYTIPDYDEANRLQGESDAALQAVADAGEKGDAYDLAGVLLAVALFIGGIGTLFKKPILSWWLIGLGAVATVAGGIVAFTA